MAKTSLHAFKAKDTRFVATGWKAKACTSFVLYLKVFKNHLYYLWHVRVLSIKPCLHTQLPGHNKSYRKVSPGVGAFDRLGWTYDGAFEQLFGLGRGEFDQKFSKNSNARRVARGGCWSFDFTGTLIADFRCWTSLAWCWPKGAGQLGTKMLKLPKMPQQ